MLLVPCSDITGEYCDLALSVRLPALTLVCAGQWWLMLTTPAQVMLSIPAHISHVGGRIVLTHKGLSASSSKALGLSSPLTCEYCGLVSGSSQAVIPHLQQTPFHTSP